MSSVPEQLAAAAKAHFETQLRLLNTLAGKAFDGAEQLIELNLDTAKSSMQDATAAAGSMATASDPQAFLSVSGSQVQPAVEKAMDYNRRLAEINEKVYLEFSRMADQQVAESRKKLEEMIAEAMRNAPPGSENAIAVMKSMLSNADATYDQMMASTRQALETLRANMVNAGDQFTQAAQNAAKGGR
jgi:phasin family protein